MIKVRIQGTKEEMDRFLKKLKRVSGMQVCNISEPFSNIGTKKFFRRYFEIELYKE